MAYEPKPGQFSLFKNDKEGNEKRPDYKGDGMDIDGRAIKISAWMKDGAKGKFMSCKIELKDADQSRPAAKAEAKRPAPIANDGFDEEAPF